MESTKADGPSVILGLVESVTTDHGCHLYRDGVPVQPCPICDKEKQEPAS